MKLKTIYLVLCVLGAALPYSQFIPWLAGHGLDMPLFYQQLFVNHISAFFGMDVLVSAAALLVFVAAESFRLGMRGWWLPVVAVFTVGVSRFSSISYMRELKLERGRRGTKTATA